MSLSKLIKPKIVNQRFCYVLWESHVRIRLGEGDDTIEYGEQSS
jgi:hypothetical protein